MIRFLPFTLFVSLVSLITLSSCGSSKSAKGSVKDYRAAFYNVENLFDTIDHPVKLDDDFTPSGRQEWNTRKYKKKLDQLARVVEGMAFPDILGLCEVENHRVLEDFTGQVLLKPFGYDFVHFDSPDMRGIDVALLYKKSVFKVETSRFIRIPFPPEIEPDYTSRDILYVRGKFKGKAKIHLFINHWPSRRGGLQKSEPKRTHVASYLREEVNKIFEAEPDANILIMGDLNDEPGNKSVSNVLSAQALDLKVKEKQLYNCMVHLDNQNKGTYNYRGNWNMLDHIIISTSMADKNGLITAQNASIFRMSWMMYKDQRFGETPNRTYGGPNYYGGFSDHLPVYVDLKVRTK